MKVIVNSIVVFSNMEVKGLIRDKKWDFAGLTEEEDKKEVASSPPVLLYKLDEYKLPPIVTRNLKDMDVGEVRCLDTTKVAKFATFFPDPIIRSDWVKPGDRVRLYLKLLASNKAPLRLIILL
jgi:hypothetical protein